jgi:hypothetical protein
LSTGDSMLVVHGWSIRSDEHQWTREGPGKAPSMSRMPFDRILRITQTAVCRTGARGAGFVRGLVVRCPPKAESHRAGDSNQVIHPQSYSHSEVPPVGFEFGPTSKSDLAEPFEARSWTVEGPVRLSDTPPRLFLVSRNHSSRSRILR